MIKNIVFDLGNVLVEFKPQDYIKRIGIDENLISKLYDMVFEYSMWDKLDRGTISLQQYISTIKAKNSEYIEYLDIIFADGWISKLLKQKEDTAMFLQQISSQKNVYVLSNISEPLVNYVKTLEFWKYVKGSTFSYSVNSCKPEKKIYTTFLKENNLIPEECLFLDDREENIKSAKEFGMNGIVFKGDFSDNENEIYSILYK